MSLYDNLFGCNENMKIFLGMISLHESEFLRFRDIYLDAKGDKIIVLTRCGGMNREYANDMYNKIRKHPNYIYDWDDEFDNTYSYITFTIPEKYKNTAKSMATGVEQLTLKEKFELAIKRLDDPNSKESKAAEKIMNKIEKAFNDPKSGNIIEI